MVKIYAVKRLFLLILIILPLSTAALFPDHQEPVRVMLLYPYSQQREWKLEFEESYYQAIKKSRNATINTYVEYIEAGLINDEESLEQAAVRMTRILERIKPDIIVSLFSSMHDFILYYEDGALLEKTNIFVPSVPSRTEQYLQTPNLYLIESSAVSALKGTVTDIESLFPELKELIVISGSGQDDLVYLSIFNNILAGIDHEYSVTELTGLSLEELKKKIFVLPENSAILYLPINRDNYGNSYFEELIFPELTDAADAPVFTFYDTPIGQGVTGGRVTSAKAYGRQAAETIIAQLHGDPSNPSINKGELSSMYDWRQLEKWNINEKNLPEGSLILYRPESFFQKYRRQIILITLFILLETVLIILLLMSLIQRRRTELLLLNSEDLLQRSENTARLGGWDFYPETNSLSYTKEVLNIFGFKQNEILTPADVEGMVAPEDFQTYKNGFDEVIATGRNFQAEFRIIPRDSDRLWVEINCSAVKTNGKVVRISGTVQDISERKEYEHEIKSSLKQKDILLQEVHHRVKNNLAIITSLLSMQSAYIKNSEAKKILLDSSNRINSLALIYEQIYFSDDIETVNISEYIKQLVGNLLAEIPKDINPVRIEYEVSSRNISIDRMIPLGLIINEAVYNSLIHAFKGTENPEIIISSGYSGDNKTYSIRIKDNGTGIADIDQVRDSKTLGFLLINTLVEQINGELEISNKGGLDIRLTFPMSGRY